MCGLAPGEIDPDTGRKVHLHIGYIKDNSLGGKDEFTNLRALCLEVQSGRQEYNDREADGNMASVSNQTGRAR